MEFGLDRPILNAAIILFNLPLVEHPLKRKLTTIFCADVQRYSALMKTDEAGTLERLQRYRNIMNELFERREGRKVNTWGDAVIAEFDSVVEAVRCAVEIQDAIGGENRDLPEEQQMWFRIGINLGDVMVDNDDLYGDGVNIAARLESLAPPGGIMVSETVYTMAHKQLTLGFDYIGDQTVKNLEDPIRSWQVRMPGRNEPEPVSFMATSKSSLDEDNSDTESRPWLVRIADRIERTREWLKVQPKKVRYSAGLIGLFVGLNILFSGIANPWFIFPSAPFALYIYLHIRAQRGKE